MDDTPARIRSGLRHALLDLGFDDGEQFALELLTSGDFSQESLRTILPGGGGKREHAKRVAWKIIDDNADADPLLLAFCEETRSWCSVMSHDGASPNKVAFESARAFVAGQPRDGWFGPWKGAGETTWYVCRKAAKHRIVHERGKYDEAKIIWHIVFQVTKTHLVAHWHGFTYNETGQSLVGAQYPYWKHVPDAMEHLAEELGLTFTWPTLNQVVLYTLMDAFDGDPAYTWKHLKVRSEREGVVLNAKGSGARRGTSGKQARKGRYEIDITGLKVLSRALAKSALNAAYDDVGDADVDLADVAVLRTMIREWGTLSYEFSLDGNDEGNKMCRIHAYFGTGDDEEASVDAGDQAVTLAGQDRFPHMMCYQNYGGSRAAFEFLLPHL